jgi:pimeloyl-ACP methyl ester carboxylesterase
MAGTGDEPTIEGDLSRRPWGAALAGGAMVSGAFGQAVAARPAPWTGEGFIQRPGGRLHYVSLGEGPPLILLHKLGGWIAEWEPIAPLLAAHYRVIAFDMPGHGESFMDQPAPYILTLGESAAMIRAALQDMGVEQSVFVGASLGGCCAAVLAACYPEAVSRLVLISVALFSRQTRADQAKDDERVKADYGPHGEPLPRSEARVAEFGNLDPRINEENNRSRAKAGAWVRASERGVGVAGVDSFLPRIDAPTLLVYADRGRYTRFETVGRAKIRNVSVSTIKDSGSFTYQEKPEQTAAALLSFLKT